MIGALTVRPDLFTDTESFSFSFGRSGRENEIARKVLIKHLQSGNSYGIQLKEKHCKFPQPELGSWVEGSRIVGDDWHAPVLEGWQPPAH